MMDEIVLVCVVCASIVKKYILRRIRTYNFETLLSNQALIVLVVQIQ